MINWTALRVWYVGFSMLSFKEQVELGWTYRKCKELSEHNIS